VISALLLIIAMQAAAPPNTRTMTAGMIPPATIETVVVARDMMSQIDSPRQVVVRTPGEWATLWRQHAGESAAPKVDLGTRTLVAIFLGSRPSAGFTVDIIGTRETGGVLTVQWRERRPDRGDVTAQVLTSPMVMASMPKFAGEIRFEKVEK
jgi:hypothetical protein